MLCCKMFQLRVFWRSFFSWHMKAHIKRRCHMKAVYQVSCDYLDNRIRIRNRFIAKKDFRPMRNLSW